MTRVQSSQENLQRFNNNKTDSEQNATNIY